MENEIKGREIALLSLLEYSECKRTLKNKLDVQNFTTRDREIGKAYDYFYGCVRLKKRLDYIMEKHLHNYSISDIPPPIYQILKMGIYGLEFSSDEGYAVVNSMVNLAKKYGHNGTASLVNGVLRNIHPVEYPREKVEFLSVFYSYPSWLVSKLLDEYNEKTEKILKAGNKYPGISIRVSRLRTSPEELKEKLREEGIDFEESKISDNNLITDGKVLKTDAFKKGYMQVQSATQTRITELLQPEENDIILDLCASPGGKSTCISELTSDKATVLSVDKKGLNDIVSNKKRLKLKNIFPVKADARRFHVNKADRIMLDVPCTGTGVMGSKGDIRWNVNKDTLKRLKKLQRELLEGACTNLPSGGRMVYSTCSILSEENEKQVENFIENRSEFRIIPLNDEEMYFKKLPGFETLNGGFAVIIERR